MKQPGVDKLMLYSAWLMSLVVAQILKDLKVEPCYTMLVMQGMLS